MEALEGDAPGAMLADDANQVHDGGTAFGARDEPVRSQHVAGNAVDRLEALEVAFRAGAHEASHEEAAARERANEIPANESRPAGDKDALHDGRIVA